MAAPKKKTNSRPPSTSKKTNSAKKKTAASLKSLGTLFWLVFFIVIICLFIVNWPKIQETVRDTKIFERLGSREQTEETQPQLQPQLDPRPEPEPYLPEVVVERPPQSSSEPVPQTPVLREQSIYLIRIDAQGDVYVVKVNRQLPITNNTLVDTLASLMTGPTTDELNRGLVSLIPKGTRIIPGQTTVKGSTAEINLSEDMQYNTDGIEGYVAALRQIIWTATEFANIEDVQILIEGRRIDYLGGDGIWIGSPLNRRF